MPAPRKYPDELRDRAQRLVAEAMSEDAALSLNAAVKRIASKVGVVPDTLRGWVRRACGKSDRIDAEVAARSVLAVQLVGGREPSSARLITAPGDRGLYSHQDNLRVQMALFPGFAAARWMDQPGSPCQVASGSQGVGWLES